MHSHPTGQLLELGNWLQY